MIFNRITIYFCKCKNITPQNLKYKYVNIKN